MKKYLEKIISQQDLTVAEASEVLKIIMSGQASEIEISAFLVSLSAKGESIKEIVGMVKIMRKFMHKVNLEYNLLDTCGTGGDGLNTINVSTAAAIVCAAAGCKVAKHGNKAASSKSGSADVLEALGVKVDLGPDQVKRCIEEVGIGFMFAPVFHPAMKYVVPVRTALGIRTIFNFLGPLSNPAGALYQMIGVSDEAMAPKLGQALMELGSERVIIVHAEDGLDEVSVSDKTKLFIFNNNQDFQDYKIEPDKKYKIEDVKGGDAKQNAQDIRDIFNNKIIGAKKDFVVYNAAMGLLAYELVDDFEKGKQKAREVIEGGDAKRKLDELIKITNGL